MLDNSPRHIVAAAALITNDRGEMALVRTERRGWELPGGQIESGESLLDGLKREVREECGIDIDIGRLLQVRSNLSSSIVIFCFEATYVSGELRPSEETPAVRWADAQTALDLISQPVLLLCLRDLLRSDRPTLYHAYRSAPFELLETREI
ncbi:MAG: NUDIX hydrolase [Chloroflexota bacterium]|nr:NUDIX hydrolase [Chloroflexota bacterium]